MVLLSIPDVATPVLEAVLQAEGTKGSKNPFPTEIKIIATPRDDDTSGE